MLAPGCGLYTDETFQTRGVMNETRPDEYLFTPCTCALLRRATRAVTQFYDLVLSPSGLHITQFTALKAMYESGRVVQCLYSKENDVAVETLSRRFAALQRKGWIQMQKGNHSERIYSLTGTGQEVFLSALPYWKRAQERLTQVFGAKQCESLAQLCCEVSAAANHAGTIRVKNYAPKSAWNLKQDGDGVGATVISNGTDTVKKNVQETHISKNDFKAQLQEQLQAQRIELLQAAERMTSQGRELGTDGPQDTGDSSLMNYSKEALFAENSRNRQLLRRIDSALERIRGGSFGRCVSCDAEIGFRRLSAVPWTQYCIRCQERIESRPRGDQAA